MLAAWRSVADAEADFDDPAVSPAMQDAGVRSKPDVTFLDGLGADNGGEVDPHGAVSTGNGG